jgi:hypothetical protein
MSQEPYYTQQGTRLFTEEEVAAYFEELIGQYETYYQQLLSQNPQMFDEAYPISSAPLTEEETKKMQGEQRKEQIGYLKEALVQIKEYEKSVRDEIKRLESEEADARKSEPEEK